MSGGALILRPERQPSSVVTAPVLRLERMRAWLAAGGYGPVAVSGRSSRSGRGRGTVRAAADAALAIAAAPAVAARAARTRPALVLANTPLQAPALALTRACLRGRVVAVADVMGLHSLEADQTTRVPLVRAAARPAWRVLERLLLNSADLILTVNDRHAELVRDIAPTAFVRTVRDCAEAEPPLVATPRRDGGGGTMNVVFTGALVCARLDPLLDAWELLAGDPDAPRLVVVGDGPDLAAVRRRVRESRTLARRVELLGPLPRAEALAIVAASDAACSDCWSDAGFPSKTFEYMALGTPALVQDRPQIREVLRHEENALLWRDARELAAQARRLAAEGGLRERIAGSARADFLTFHTEEHRAGEFSASIDAARVAARERELARRARRRGEQRPAPELEAQYAVEREAREEILAAPPAQRADVYARAYERLLRLTPEHPTAHSDDRRIAAQFRVVEPFLSRETVFAELGAGRGELSARAATRVSRALAVDVSPPPSSAGSDVERIVADATRPPLPAAGVDVVYSDQLLEHLHPDDVLEHLRHVRRSLAPGGVLLLVTPNRWSGPHDVSGFFEGTAAAAGLHLREYSLAELVALLREAGYRAIRTRLGSRWVPPAPLVAVEALAGRAARRVPDRLLPQFLLDPIVVARS